uniref:Transcriptional regulator n=1 Tax=Heterorhabditis bacteriophora TaxID=37862 RepID=A0A1I7X2C7_HETBA
MRKMQGRAPNTRLRACVTAKGGNFEHQLN